ncbi:MAG: hypothetical protein RJB13_1410 [Pseudomonadota bacterium]
MKLITALLVSSSIFSITAFGYGNNKKKKDITATASMMPAKFEKGLLVDSKSKMTLYTFDNDTANSGKSVCNDGCIAAWPALKADASAKETGDFTVITRDDGSKQWAHKGKPLYFWVNDKKPGDTTGDKFNKIWHVVKK